MEITGAFKNRKVELKKQGFDLESVSDPICYFSAQKEKCKRLDADRLARIGSGQFRFNTAKRIEWHNGQGSSGFVAHQAQLRQLCWYIPAYFSVFCFQASQ